MKAEYGKGISSLVIIQNETPARLVFYESKDESGHIWKYPFPTTINPGANGGFLHVHTSGSACGSIGSVWYEVLDYIPKTKSWKAPNTDKLLELNFSTPYSGSNSTSTRCYVCATGDDSEHFRAVSTCGQSSSPIYEYTLTATAFD